MEFGRKRLHFTEEEIRSTPAWNGQRGLGKEMADLLLISKVLAFAHTTWTQHVSALKEFQEFCRIRSINPLDCPSPLLCTFLLSLGQNGRSFGVIKSVVGAVTFIYKFFLVKSTVVDDTITNLLRFLRKACFTIVNVKQGIGSREIRLLWDAIEKKYVTFDKIPTIEFRSFVMTVFQHSTFCVSLILLLYGYLIYHLTWTILR